MVRLLLIVLTVPLIAFGISESIQARFSASIRNVILAQAKDANPATAVATGVTGLAMLGAIALAGHLTRHNRRLLLMLFRPGLYATTVVLTGLIAVHAVLAIASIYYGESWLIERVHVGIILGIAMGAVAGVVP